MYMITYGISGRCIIATDYISTGTIVFTFDPACSQKEKTYQTIQVGPDRHCLVISDLKYLNHSCDPNLIIDSSSGSVYTQRNVYPGEELTYFYPSTEWDMAKPFLCNCGNPACIRYVRGAYWTSLHILAHHFINKHIVDLILAKINYANDLSNFLQVK